MLTKEFSPTHARILFMFDQLKGKHFTYGLNNLYISGKFSRASISETDQKVMTHGVCRVHDRGLPKCVIMV